MNTEISRKQRLKFFFLNVAAFASIFLLLGFITLQLLQSSAYRQTDLSLTQMAENEHLIQMEINRYQQSNPFLAQMPGEQLRENRPEGNNQFNTQIILWSKEGTILNKDTIGGRFTELENLTLDKKNLDSVQALSLKMQAILAKNFPFIRIQSKQIKEETSPIFNF